MRPLRILIWHVHGSYLYYLTQAFHHTFYLPSKPDRSQGYVGRWGHIPWSDNVYDIPVENIHSLDLDCIVFQSPEHYFQDQYEILSEEQRKLPQIYLEHDPPREHPTDTSHPIDNPNVLLVHVTSFNNLMWNNNRTPTCVIEHGVIIPENVSYRGEIERGLVVVNHLKKRGRRLGHDIFKSVRKKIPLDLVGMEAEKVPGGLGEVRHDLLPAFESRYRFFFHPIRYTSFGLAVCEAMMIGMPIVGLATTEMATVIKNDVSGYIDTNIHTLIDRMKELLHDPLKAHHLGKMARQYAKEHFNIHRFIHDWDKAFQRVTGFSSR